MPMASVLPQLPFSDTQPNGEQGYDSPSPTLSVNFFAFFINVDCESVAGPFK